MKKVEITATVPANPDKGIPKELSGTIQVDYPESGKELLEAYGDEAVLSNAFANWRVTLQSNIRAGLKKGETQEQIQARLANAKMGVATSGVRVDPKQAFLAMFASASPEERKALLAELRSKASE